jgi:hypothetical protein
MYNPVTRTDMVEALVREAMTHVIALDNEGQLLLERALKLWYDDMSYTKLENDYNATFNLV